MKEVILIWYIFICFYYSFCFARVSFLIGKQESPEELEFVDKAWVNGRRYSAETWHEYCKGVLLGFDIKAMPDGTEVKTPISTTTLNTAEMTDYQNRLQSWAAGEFGIIWEF